MTTIKVGRVDAEGFHPNGTGEIVDIGAIDEYLNPKLAAKANATSLAAKLDKTEAATTYVPLSKDAGDSFATITKRLQLTDTANAKGSVINIEHYGDGTNPESYNGQTFGLDIHNNPGANIGIVFHQYSNT